MAIVYEGEGDEKNLGFICPEEIFYSLKQCIKISPDMIYLPVTGVGWYLKGLEYLDSIIVFGKTWGGKI